MPASTPSGDLTATITFAATMGPIYFTGTVAITGGAAVISEQPQSRNVLVGVPVTLSVTAAGSGLTYEWSKDGTTLPGETDASLILGSPTVEDTGKYLCTVTSGDEVLVSDSAELVIYAALPTATAYRIVDTRQTLCFDDANEISAPAPGEAFYGQDGQINGYQPTYIDCGNGTIYDAVTGLMWTQSSDLDGDGEVTDSDDKRTQADAVALMATLNAQNHLGYNDWRVPTIKELYSLMDFRGTDPTSSDTSPLVKFIDESYFTIGFGDESAGDRVIDSQFVTTSIYVSTVMGGQEAMFGLNLVDGRIKGYPTQGKSFYVLLCRGNTDYGINQFIDNTDGTITDTATKLMWAQNDSGTGMDWEGALAWVQTRNAENYLGYSDWCLPDIKELHSLLDYTRSPDTTASAAIDPLFNCTAITNLAGQADFPWYWSGTTHLNSAGNASRASYICFGRGLGSMDGSTVIDVHGAGCQRSDPKSGSELDYPAISRSPQGDVENVFNHVRPVRVASQPTFSAVLTADQTELKLSWESEAGRVYTIEFSGDLSGFSDLVTRLTGTPPLNRVNLPLTGDKGFFLVRRE